MANQVIWTKIILEEFIKDGCLTEFDTSILRMHCAGYSRVKISDIMCCSVSTTDRAIARLKRKYDEVAKYNLILPPRQKFHDLITPEEKEP